MKPVPESTSQTIGTLDDNGTLLPGSVLQNTFRVRHLLAEGGMGMVYLATHERLPGLFVVKTVHPDSDSADEGAARLQQEAEVLASLNHPNIVRVFDFNTTQGGTPYLVLEFLEGRDLNDILNTRVLHPWEVAAVVRQVASALGAAHACDVIHRDLKPENVLIVPLVGQADVVKLIDFGASKVSLSTRIHTRRGIIGTPNYMSPEQVNGPREQVGARSDQFALAVMTYEMLARQRPFSDDDPVAVLHQIVNRPAPPLALAVDWSPIAVEQVLARGMAKEPADRYATVLEFSQAFDQAVRTDIGGTPQPLRLLVTDAQHSAEDTLAAHSAGRQATAPINPGPGPGPGDDRDVPNAMPNAVMPNAVIPKAVQGAVDTGIRTGVIQRKRRRWQPPGGLLYIIATAMAGVLGFAIWH